MAAASMGVPLVRTKLLAYATGAAFGGMAGAFLGSYLNTVNADQFLFSFSIFMLAMVILGGLGSIWGVVLGAVVLSFINTWLIPDVLNEVPSKVGLDFDLTQLSFGIFGFLLVIMMVLRPEGLLPERRRKIELTEGVGARARRCTRRAHDRRRRTHATRSRRHPRGRRRDKAFGGLVAVSEVSFAIPRGSIVSIIGPNGAGKTTFFNMLTGLYKPTAGRIAFDGDDITGGRPDKIMSLGHGPHVPEHPPVRDHDRGRERAGGPARPHEGEACSARSCARPACGARSARRARRRARRSSTSGSSKSVFDEMSANLSYGDQRRLEIARALASDPTLLLLDEPTAGMNPQGVAPA